MGRGRGGKGKKVGGTNQEDTGSGEEEKIPTQKRRGRPHKSLKEEMDEDEVEAVKRGEDEDSEETAGGKGTPNVKKRKKNLRAEAKVADQDNETVNGIKDESPAKGSAGFRHRRKSKPRRAAEAVVECCN